MNVQEAITVLRRIDAIWPRREAAADGEYDEWIDFLSALDGKVAIRAVGEMREQMKWRPTMAEFRVAYWAASTLPDENTKLLPGQVEPTTAEKNKELYGEDPKRWVYCWRCGMAIPLADWREDDEKRGLVHPGRKCPRRGSAPSIPNDEKLRRDEYFRKNGISLVGK